MRSGSDVQVEKKLLQLINGEPFRELEKYYSNKTIMDILGVSRNENKHSNIIAWILSSDEEHDLGDYPLRKLLETICFIKIKLGSVHLTEFEDWILPEEIISGNYKISDIKVKREKLILDKKRLDIYIEFTIRYSEKEEHEVFIIIENKIDSNEGENQTTDYYNWAKQHASNEKKKFIGLFLSPSTKQEYNEYLKNGKNTKCQCVEFIQINYQYLVDGVIEPCALRVKSYENKYIIENYLRCLSQPSLKLIVNDSNQYRGPHTKKIKKHTNDVDIDFTILAVSKKEKDMVQRIWSEHENILTSIISTIYGNVDDLKVNDISLIKKFYNSRKTLKLVLYVLAIILRKNETNENQDCINMLNAIVGNKIAFKFNGEIYNSYNKKKKSYGWLGRNLIEEYLKIITEENVLLESIDLLRDNKWSSPWLEKILIFEVDFIKEDARTQGHYFNKSEELIRWNNSKDLYAARYWTKEDIFVLADILKLNDKISILYF